MSAQVTEAHRALALEIQLECAGDYELDEPTTAQLIADSEAKACDQLRAERDSIKQEIEMVEHRAYRAEAELAKERARLDWLETDVGIDWQWEPSRLTVSRAAIDAAMKEDAK